MKILLLVLGLLVAVYVVHSGIRFYLLLQVSKKLVESTAPFSQESGESENASAQMLVLGDSTAVGVGAATPAESVPGRVATYISATAIENYAISGGIVDDLATQAARARFSRYDLILIQIGANDMVRFHDADESAKKLETVLAALPPSDRVIVISAADLGTARIFPSFLRPYYSRLNREYHAAFLEAATRQGATYIDLSQGPGNERFAQDPATYFASDRFHLSSVGYGLWFDAIKEELERR